MYDLLVVRHCNHSSVLYRFRDLMSNNIVTLKSGLEAFYSNYGFICSRL